MTRPSEVTSQPRGISLEGRIALVTGAGRQHGIGRAIAIGLAQAGADVMVHGAPRDPTQYPDHERNSGWRGVASVAAEISAMGCRAHSFEADLTERTGVQELFAAAEKQLGTVDVLVNNAATAGATGETTLADLPNDEWYRTVDVNLNGLYLVCQAAVHGMRRANGGSIVNVGSLAGLKARSHYGAYPATKFAMIGLTQQLALEFAPLIRVNCVCPGSTDTEMMEGTFSRTDARLGAPSGTAKAALVSRIPMGRQAQPAEIASAVVFFASDAARFITGQSLRVDGGQDLR